MASNLKLLFFRGLALALLAFVLLDAYRFPVFSVWIVAGLMLYAVILAVEVRSWLLVLPSAIAVLSFGYWSGRYFWDVFDLFILMTLAGGLWCTTPWWPEREAVKRLWPIGVFALAHLGSTLNGLFPFEIGDGVYSQSYYSPLNALREAKGVFWALLLVPMLLQAQRIDGATLMKWITAGVAAGLLALFGAVLWERNLYTGIANLQHPYRVSGGFFDLHTGGASIDVALVMMLPFVPGIWVWWRKWPAYGAMTFLLATTFYSLFVTFSRANYGALFVVAAIFVIGLLTLPAQVKELRHGVAVKGGLIAMGLVAMLPVLLGGTIAERFQTTAQDLEIRLRHWERSMSLVSPGQESLLGIGKGEFPRRYHLDSMLRGTPLSTMSLQNAVGRAYLHLSASDRNGNLDLRQRFDPPLGTVRLEIVMRTHSGESERLLIEFCERHVLRVRKECKWVGTNIPDSDGAWVAFNSKVNLSALGQGSWLTRSPVDVSILNRGIKHGLEIASIRLFDASGQNLLSNSDFKSNLDHWFFVDGNHLRWHVKNLFVYLFVEGGLAGLATFLVLALVTLARAWRIHRAGDPAGVIFAAAIGAGLTIGLIDSVLDAPRITVLFLLMLFLPLLWRPVPVPLAVSFVHYPKWLPGPGRIALGAVSALVLIIAAKQFLSTRLSFGQAVVHYGQMIGIDSRTLLGLMNRGEGDITPDLALDPTGRQPRLWQQVNGSKVGGCDSEELGPLLACWVAERNESAGARALGLVEAMTDDYPRITSNYGNGWLLAIAYDLLSDHPALSSERNEQFKQRLQMQLGQHLLLLNGDGPTVWHGRATLAAQAMVISAMLDPSDPFVDDLMRQAHIHYLRLLNALSVAEAWPEGYNYWVNSRGFLIALAGYAYVTAFPRAPAVDETRRIFSRLGLWHIHNTRPDVKAVQIADEGPRIDLAEGTQRIVDLFSLVTRDPWLDSYSAMLDQKHGKRGYYRDNRWMRPLLQASAPRAAYVPPLESWALPTAEWFGRDGMNMFYMRSDWGRDATMLSFRAGHNLSHHGHYDAGHFTLFKGAPLAVTGATYRGSVTAGHRLDYGVRTVSKNSLLVMRPGEEVKPEHYERKNKADGGQRLTMPIRSPLSTLEYWRANLGDGHHLEGGRIRHYEHRPDAFTYIDADITDAYNTPRHDEGGDGGKVSLVTRQLLYLRRLDRVLIRDRVICTDPAFKAKWLLQSLVKPEMVNGMQLKGSADNGILATEQAEFRFTNDRGRLHVLSLQPEDRETLVIGGKNYRFYVDVDGDAETLDGEIMGEDSRITKWFEPAEWRLEISGRRSVARQDFLTVLSPSLDEFNPPIAGVLDLESDGAIAAHLDDEIIVFAEDPQIRELAIPGVAGASILRIFGLPPNGLVLVSGAPYEADSAGSLSIDISGEPATLSWPAPETLGSLPVIR